MAPLKCPKCGNEVPEGALVSLCPACFEPLPSSPAPEAPRPAEHSQAAAPQAQVRPMPAAGLPPPQRPLSRERAEAAWAVTDAAAPERTFSAVGLIVGIATMALAVAFWALVLHRLEGRPRSEVRIPARAAASANVPRANPTAGVSADQVDLSRLEEPLVPGAPTGGGGSLHDAVSAGNVAAAERLLAEGADPNGRAPAGATPLYAAVERRNTPMAELLLTHKADPNARSGPTGETALHCAVRQGDMEMARLLLEHEADPNARLTSSRETALHLAAARGELEMVKLLVAHGADAGSKNASGRTAAEIARANGEAAIADLLERRSQTPKR
jgi:hypothetical protein